MQFLDSEVNFFSRQITDLDFADDSVLLKEVNQWLHLQVDTIDDKTEKLD